ncbi:membrane-bound alkaline phosphatase [Caerostris extrusa]|uniref:alkaline phosphatase n=1 Tax=Caerostris extrusa TaxID=172846 RepID=A0AAV4WHJ1_CAEEX|nr:membrane-bound alkaline phosphatase [Caerostris extrusa]
MHWRGKSGNFQRTSEVILGGGRRHFLPHRELDTKNPENAGRREDGRNLIEEWQRDKKSRGLSYKYVSRKRELDKVDPLKVDYLLGLFSPGHMAYESDRDNGVEGRALHRADDKEGPSRSSGRIPEDIC